MNPTIATTNAMPKMRVLHETRAAMAQRVEANLAAALAGKPMVSAAA